MIRSYDYQSFPQDIRAKLTEYLFLNLAYILRECRETIKYGFPEYDRTDKGFTTIMYRVKMEAYAYGVGCLKVLGCNHVTRECGPTTAALFDSPEESMAKKAEFIWLLEKAQKGLSVLNDLTPHEYYLLQANPIIIDSYNTPNKHFAVLQVELDAFHRFLWDEEGGWGDIIENDEEPAADGPSKKVLVTCYKKRERDRFLWYLERRGVSWKRC